MANKASLFGQATEAGFTESEALEYAGLENYFIVLEQDTTDGYFDLVWVAAGSIYEDMDEAITEAIKCEGRVVDMNYRVKWTSPQAPDVLKKIT